MEIQFAHVIGVALVLALIIGYGERYRQKRNKNKVHKSLSKKVGYEKAKASIIQQLRDKFFKANHIAIEWVPEPNFPTNACVFMHRSVVVCFLSIEEDGSIIFLSSRKLFYNKDDYKDFYDALTDLRDSDMEMEYYNEVSSIAKDRFKKNTLNNPIEDTEFADGE